MSIDYGVPVPPAKSTYEHALGKRVREAMEQMLIGGSQFFACESVREENLVRSTVGRVIVRTYQSQRRYVTRKVSEMGKVGIRVWRET